MAQRDRAIYMREYRQRTRPDLLAAHVRDLEGEVQRLTALLAERQSESRPVALPAGTSFNSRPFTPAPKSGR